MTVRSRFLILFVATLFIPLSICHASGTNGEGYQQLLKLRAAYYQAIESNAPVDSVINAFESFGAEEKVYRTIADAYIGSLTAFKGRDAFWPQQKLDYVKQGMGLLDEALATSDGNLEVIFIHATTCSYLPFFFGRKDDAREGFKVIAERLPNETEGVDDSLVVNITEFLSGTDLMTKDELEALQNRAGANEAGDSEVEDTPAGEDPFNGAESN